MSPEPCKMTHKNITSLISPVFTRPSYTGEQVPACNSSLQCSPVPATQVSNHLPASRPVFWLVQSECCKGSDVKLFPPRLQCNVNQTHAGYTAATTTPLFQRPSSMYISTGHFHVDPLRTCILEQKLCGQVTWPDAVPASKATVSVSKLQSLTQARHSSPRPLFIHRRTPELVLSSSIAGLPRLTQAQTSTHLIVSSPITGLPRLTQARTSTPHLILSSSIAGLPRLTQALTSTHRIQSSSHTYRPVQGQGRVVTFTGQCKVKVQWSYSQAGARSRSSGVQGQGQVVIVTGRCKVKVKWSYSQADARSRSSGLMSGRRLLYATMSSRSSLSRESR